MQFQISSILLSALFFLKVLGDELNCGYACQDSLSYITFNGTDPDADYYTAQCTNLYRVQSIYLCMRHYCTQEETDASIADFASLCEVYGGVTLLDISVIDNITDSDAEKLQQVDVADLGSTDAYGAPVFVAQGLFDISFRTENAWSYSEETRALYGYACLGFWAIVLFIGMTNHLLHWLGVVTNIKTPSPLKTTRRLLKQHVTTPALFGHRSAETVGWCTIPTRIETLTIAAFVIINFVLSCVTYDLFTGNLYWADTSTQLTRYLADRTGVMAIANLPLVFAFGTRNDVLLWLTGWSFATFNQFHRWVARVATIQAVVHSIAYTIEAFQDGGAEEFYADCLEQYWQLGIVATIAMSLICGFSVLPFRRYWYEIFLILHIVFAVLTIVGMWYHVEIFDGEYNPYLWPCIAVWVFDRAVRYGRILVLNPFFQKATASYNCESNLIRLNIPHRSNIAKPGPGTYYYVYLLHGFKFWESHPFTLSDWTMATQSTEQNRDGQITQSSLKFVVRPYDGFTRRLRNTLLSRKTAEDGGNVSVSHSVRAFVEGPYSIPHNLTTHKSLLLVMAGSGITVSNSHLRHIAELSGSSSKHFNLQSVKLIWIIRNVAMFHDIFQHELRQSLVAMQRKTDLKVSVDIFITGKTPSITSSSSRKASSEISPVSDTAMETKIIEAGLETGGLQTNTVKDNDEKNGLDIKTKDVNLSSASSFRSEIAGYNITIQTFRPNVADLIVEHAQTYNASNSKDDKDMAIVACGPARLADDARAGTVRALGLGYDWIDYYPESFNW